MELTILFPVSISTWLMGSSRISIELVLRKDLARAIRCFWPPESITPLSPTMVSKPFLNEFIVSYKQALFTAFIKSALLIFFFPNKILSKIVPENKKGSWGIKEICCLRSERSMLRILPPAMDIFPEVTSKSLGIRLTRVVLPLPGGPTMPRVMPCFSLISILLRMGIFLLS